MGVTIAVRHVDGTIPLVMNHIKNTTDRQLVQRNKQALVDNSCI
jgi:hypothetical protein